MALSSELNSRVNFFERSAKELFKTTPHTRAIRQNSNNCAPRKLFNLLLAIFTRCCCCRCEIDHINDLKRIMINYNSMNIYVQTLGKPHEKLAQINF
jgi:diphthamide synthase subunit DPH2